MIHELLALNMNNSIFLKEIRPRELIFVIIELFLAKSCKKSIQNGQSQSRLKVGSVGLVQANTWLIIIISERVPSTGVCLHLNGQNMPSRWTTKCL